MKLQRYLDHIEVRSVNNAPSYVLSYSGGVDADTVSTAYRLLCLQYPVLRARIRFDGVGYQLFVPPEGHQDVDVWTGGEDALREAIHEPWNCADYVAKLILVQDEERGYLALRVDHAVADGGIKMAIFREMLALYASLRRGAEPNIEPGTSLPSAPYALIKERMSGRSSRPPTGPVRAPHPRYRLLERRILLSAEETAGLVRAARLLGTSVHAVIAGSVLVSHRNQGSPRGPVPMMCWSPVNVRNRVKPPVAATQTTNMSLIQETVVSVPPHGDPIEVGREVKKLLDDDIAHERIPTGEPHRADTTLEPHLATVLISNYGVMQPFDAAPGMVITDFQTLSHPMVGTYPSYGAYTFGDRLSMPIRYPREKYREDEVQAIMDEIVFHLRDIAGSLAGCAVEP